MSGGRSAVGILTVLALCVLALAYLYQHSRSVTLARELFSLAVRTRALRERGDSLAAERARLVSFARLDSIWTAQGRPRVMTGITSRGADSALAILPSRNADAGAR